MSGLRLGEGNDLPNRGRAGHEHRHSIQTERDATVRRTAVVERIQEESEPLFCLFSADPQNSKDRKLHFEPVDTYRPAPNLRTTHRPTTWY